MRIFYHRFALIAFSSLAILFAGALFSCTSLLAQDPEDNETTAPAAQANYDQLKVDSKLRTKASIVMAIIRKGKFDNDEEKKLFNDFFKNYFLSRWTAADDKDKIVYADKDSEKGYRIDLRNVFRNAKSGAVYDYLNELVLAELGKMAAGNYHPAVRFNAIMAIADLNVLEVGSNETPKPLPKAISVLLDAVKDAKQIDAVKVAALTGINRHVKLDAVTDPAVRSAITAELLKLVAVAAPPEGRTSDGHAWMRAQAAEILGRLASPGAKGDVVGALAGLAADQTVMIPTRREAVRSLGRIQFDDASRAQAGKGASATALYVCDAWGSEETNFSRRRLKDRMAAAYFAVNGDDYAAKDPKKGFGLAVGATDAAGKKTMAVLKPAMQAILDALDDTRTDDLNLMTKVGDQVDKIRNVLPSETEAAPAAPAAPAKAQPKKNT